MSDDDGKITITYRGIMDHIINLVITWWKGDPWAIGKHRQVSALFERPGTLLKSSPPLGPCYVEFSALSWQEGVGGVPLWRRTSLHGSKGLSWHQDQSVKATGNWVKDLREIMCWKLPCTVVQLEGWNCAYVCYTHNDLWQEMPADAVGT